VAALRVAIIDNPVSFRGPYPVDRIRPILAAAGWVPRVYHRGRREPLGTLVARARDDGAELVVAAGGDGTLRDIASALAGSGVPVGVLPGGTANVFAREMGIPHDPSSAALALVEGVNRPLDLGRVTLPDGRWGRFVIAAGLGLDGAIVAATPAAMKRALGPVAIGLAAAMIAPTWRSRAVRVRVDGLVSWEGQAWQLIAGNTRLYANVVLPNPRAVLDDGRLDLCILPAASVGRLIRLGLSLAATRIPPDDHAIWLVGRSFDVEVMAGTLPLELDGTPVRAAASRFRLTAEPGAFLARVPAGDASGRFAGPS
jgi:diacylglycerol kinase (ATP)